MIGSNIFFGSYLWVWRAVDGAGLPILHVVSSFWIGNPCDVSTGEGNKNRPDTDQKYSVDDVLALSSHDRTRRMRMRMKPQITSEFLEKRETCYPAKKQKSSYSKSRLPQKMLVRVSLSSMAFRRKVQDFGAIDDWIVLFCWERDTPINFVG